MYTEIPTLVGLVPKLAVSLVSCPAGMLVAGAVAVLVAVLVVVVGPVVGTTVVEIVDVGAEVGAAPGWHWEYPEQIGTVNQTQKARPEELGSYSR